MTIKKWSNGLLWRHCPEAIVLKPAIWKWVVSKRGNLYHVLNLKSEIKLIFNTVQPYDFDINEFNLTCEVQNMIDKWGVSNCPIWNRPVSKQEVSVQLPLDCMCFCSLWMLLMLNTIWYHAYVYKLFGYVLGMPRLKEKTGTTL